MDYKNAAKIRYNNAACMDSCFLEIPVGLREVQKTFLRIISMKCRWRKIKCQFLQISLIIILLKAFSLVCCKFVKVTTVPVAVDF